MFKSSAANVRLMRRAVDEADERQWFAIEHAGGIPAGKWISLRYRTSLYAPLRRPAIRLRAATWRKVLPMSAGLFGRGEWIGYIPQDTAEISIALAGAQGRVGFDLVSCVAMSHVSVLAMGLLRNFPAALFAIRLHLAGAHSKARDHLQIACGSMPLKSYHAWRAASVRPLDFENLEAPREQWREGPHIRLVLRISADDRREAAWATLESINRQHYPHWSLAFVGPSSPTWCCGSGFVPGVSGRSIHASGEGDAVALWSDLRQADIIAPVRPGDVLPAYALACLAEYALAHVDKKLIYADEDRVDENGRYSDPELKPDWSPVFFSSQPYVGSALYFRVSALSEMPGARASDVLQAGKLWMAISRTTRAVGHVRRVLLTKAGTAKPDRRAVTAVKPCSSHSGDPCATIVIPTRDRADLLSACLSALAATRPTNFEVLIVDNGSQEDTTLCLLRSAVADSRIRTLDMPGPFNFSDLCNCAAGQARGQVLVFLNNDTTIMQPDWLAHLICWATRPDVGAVGAKLLYPSGRLQHGGIVLGLGGFAAHIESEAPGDHPGYLGRLEVPHEVSAVTGACLAVEKAKFDAVGGFDAASFPIELGDVDLCLRLRARGWHTILASEVSLIHHESATRGRADDGEARYAHEHRQFRRRWQACIADDPYFHPALSLTSLRTMLDR